MGIKVISAPLRHHHTQVFPLVNMFIPRLIVEPGNKKDLLSSAVGDAEETFSGSKSFFIDVKASFLPKIRRGLNTVGLEHCETQKSNARMQNSSSVSCFMSLINPLTYFSLLE